MLASFKKGAFNNFFVSKAIRKNKKTLTLFKKIIDEILSKYNFKLDDEKAIWISTPQEELHTNNLEEAISVLKEHRKGAIFVTLVKGSEKIFIRWYDSEPQVDVLSVEGAFAIKDGRLLFYYDIEEYTEILRIIEQEFLEKLSSEDIKDLSDEYATTHQKTYFYDYINSLKRRAGDGL